MKISIILPAYNEEKTIRDTILDFFQADKEHYIYIVDNNSKDKTFEIANSVFSEFKIKGGILRESRQGKGHAMRKAFHEIDSDI